jgi:DNA-binding transcriptional MerR regulator
VAETPATFSRDELARASKLSPSELSQLERHGLVVGTSVGSQLCYDTGSLEVARLAAAFSRHGVEPRHLRMYKNSAEREAGFYEQIVLPLLKQRNPAARQQALDTLTALSELGDELRRALLRQALHELSRERKPPRRS